MWTALVGIVLGLRHALEADHVAAIGTFVDEHPRPLAAAAVGAWWGLGHAAALVLATALVTLVGGVIPESLERWLEMSVAVMLIALGARSMARAMRLTDPTGHRHADVAHLPWTPVLVGMTHGMAGSGVSTAVVLAQSTTMPSRLATLVCFGLGSTTGMVVASGALGLPMSRIAARPVAMRAVAGITGLVSATVGVVWGWSHLWSRAWMVEPAG